MSNQPIGVFDSGVGGLSVLLEIQRLLPNEQTLFLADQAFVPYGEKSKAELVDRVDRIVNFFVEQNCKAVVIACNTATVYTLSEMRERYALPIIGTVPAVKPLTQLTTTKQVGVLSTPGTTKSDYLQQLIDDFASDITVHKISGQTLEQLVETGEIDSPQVGQVLQQILQPYLAKDMDALALGCTHYPFLKDLIHQLTDNQLILVDSGEAIARRTAHILADQLAPHKQADHYYTTGDIERFSRVAQKLMQQPLSNFAKISL